jgi:dsDNA-specific endonuclease/ATPase MutS2
MDTEEPQFKGLLSGIAEMTEPVEIPIEDSIDLHAFQPREIADLIEEYLYQAMIKGFREVRIIHGRGIGAQRRIVHSILKKHPRVLSFRDAADKGSTTVTLIQMENGK